MSVYVVHLCCLNLIWSQKVLGFIVYTTPYTTNLASMHFKGCQIFLGCDIISSLRE